jgi:hypothetical protein
VANLWRIGSRVGGVAAGIDFGERRGQLVMAVGESIGQGKERVDIDRYLYFRSSTSFLAVRGSCVV